MNKQPSLESVISLYDELLIPAEESLKGMNDLFKKEYEKIKDLKNEINKTDDLKKQKEILVNCIKEMKIVSSQIRAMDESSFDKAKRNILNCIELGVIIASGLAVGIKTKSIGAGIGTSLATGIAGGVASMKMDAMKTKNGTKKYSKKAILSLLENEIDWYERYIKVLSDPRYLPYLKKQKGTSSEKIEGAYRAYGENQIGKLIKDIISYINSKVSDYAKSKYKLKLHWMYTKDDDRYIIHLDGESSDKVESIYRDPDSTDERMMSDIASVFDKISDEVFSKFKLVDYGYTIREQPDEYCEFYIEKACNRNDYLK